jgi:glycosyltransferase involved in cell wall biosynthesis
VSVIVPARNEEVSLGACLESLVGQGGVAKQIIVVDDGSTDRTREIAESFSDVRVISAPTLLPGWTGKNNAMAAGARQARGEWLLFTDADTVHLPGSLARSVAEAQTNGAALLSYSPEQEVHSFWEKAVMPLIFAELSTTYPLAKVRDPASPIAAANWQYLLISRDAYDAVGGHAAVASDLLEDVGMARLVKSSGRNLFFRYGGDVVRTRMYRSFTQLREGWTKNLALLFPHPTQLSLRLLLWSLMIVFCAKGTIGIAIYGPRLVAGIFYPRHIPEYAVWFFTFWIGLSFPILVLDVIWRSRKAHFAWDAALVSPLGLPIFSYLLLRSRLSYMHSRVQWKGRTYSGATPSHLAAPSVRSGAERRAS